MREIMKQNSFSRSLANEAKLGAYYTDVDHCMRIGRLFKWADGTVRVLEPSIGNAAAVKAVTDGCKDMELYGVELNERTYEELKEQGVCDYLLNADFLNGVKISNNKFSFCFSNPPYGLFQETGERLEKMFLEKLTGYLSPGGVLAFVIPYYVLNDETFLKCFMNRFNPLAVFRFDDDEYKKFQQICVIAVKRQRLGFMSQWKERFEGIISDVNKLPYLPKLDEPIKTKIPVAASTAEVEYFTTLKFDAKEAGEYLSSSALYATLGEKVSIPSYQSTELGHPAVPLKKDLLYLLAVSGGGQGKVGSEENRDVHLQRGVVKIVKQNDLIIENGETRMKESSYSQIVLNVIQNNGVIKTLK